MKYLETYHAVSNKGNKKHNWESSLYDVYIDSFGKYSIQKKCWMCDAVSSLKLFELMKSDDIEAQCRNLSINYTGIKL